MGPLYNPAAGDYTLLPTSPVIDAGDPTTINEEGFDGYVPQQADIGAFENELLIELPDYFFQEVEGQVVMEAEHFISQISAGERTWQVQDDLTGYTGSTYLSALPDTDIQFTPAYTLSNPKLNYTINFTTTGTYIVWLRGYTPNAAGDSLYVGLDDQFVDSLTGFTPRAWSWANRNSQNSPVTVEITQSGPHVLNLWQREDGVRVDRIVLTTNSSYTPTGNGPAESEYGGNGN